MEGLDGERWIGRKYRFEIVTERMELTGYQVYAVEKWIVERARPVTVLTVYTGDPLHKIVVTALSPVSTMTYPEAEAEFKAAVHHLRKQDGARPKEIPQGTLMVTSLAHFRSDYTIVHIPDGDFLGVQERLYSNINLLRMGCSGRSAVTLEEPSDTTKDRFKSTYFLSDGPPPAGAFRAKSHSRTHTRTYSHPATGLSLAVPEASTATLSASHQSQVISLSHPNASQTGLGTQGGSRHPHFTLYVLEFVKLLQAALAICGMFPLSPPHLPGPTFDGLLCDVTVDGLRRWVAEVGESLIGFESTGRIADPSVVAALLSFVLSTRNKLASSVQSVTKDPFLHPHDFLCVLSSYAHSQYVTNGSTPTLPALITSQFPGQPGHLSPGHGNESATSPTTSPVMANPPFVSQATSSTFNLPSFSTPTVYPHSFSPPPPASHSALVPTPITYLTLALHNSLLSQQDAKIRHSDPRRVHRVLLSKLELTSDSEGTDEERKGLGGRVMGFVGRVSVSAGPGAVGAPTAEFGTFVRGVVSGREREREREKERGKEKERERDKEKSSKDGESFKERVESADEERIGGSLRALWSGKVEGLVRMRERAEGKGWVHRGKECERQRVLDKESDRDWGKHKYRDRLTLSDVDDALMKTIGEDEFVFGGAWSGKVQKKLEMWTRINRSKKSVDLSPPTRSVGRTSSVAIPLSAQSSSSGHVYPASELKGLGVPAVILSQGNGEEDEPLSSGQVSPISVSRTHNPFVLSPFTDVSSANLPDAEKDKRLNEAIRERADNEMGERGRIRRRHTFNDLRSVRDVHVLRTDRMCIDVELCGQVLIMRRREAHLEGVVKCLEHLTTALAHNSTSLRNTYNIHKPIIDALTSSSPPSAYHQSSSHPGEPATLPTTSPTFPISPISPTLLRYNLHAHSPPALTPLMVALHALPVPPPVPALQYEAAQLRVDDMWASAREVRRKVWELRGVVFGRESVLGVGRAGSGASEVGARGRRAGKGKGRRRCTSQWRLDGSERLVDAYGRTESEAEEERAAAAGGDYSEGEDETESEGDMWAGGGDGGAVEGEREAMGPMWLLRVFTSWGARLGFLRRGTEAGVPATREPSPSTTTGGNGGGS
ncbi:hypothetical protein PAXRUDRAFT_136907 [Paxillus rubicundulus Ve08.2h10]|uniref:STB6-like N-terminal domain-containing protein n=1 Tax=Paxillus rubicundulus Ve08.2h10 TaxID=930991 RepID=A0A0D0E6K9_9AGAM|nr:hypothetical protein PAXRUDRAFT_136907 [Paxillus rubicundulus Ve08.2h10]